MLKCTERVIQKTTRTNHSKNYKKVFNNHSKYERESHSEKGLTNHSKSTRKVSNSKSQNCEIKYSNKIIQKKIMQPENHSNRWERGDIQKGFLEKNIQKRW